MIVMLVRLPPMARRTVRITQTSLPVLVIKPTVLFVKSRVRKQHKHHVRPVPLIRTVPQMVQPTVSPTRASLPVLVIKPTVLPVKSRGRPLLMLRVLPVPLIRTVPQMVQPTVSLILYVVTKPTILFVQQQLQELKLPMQFVPIVPPVQKV